jgi:type IV pilus assembly protein PilB
VQIDVPRLDLASAETEPAFDAVDEAADGHDAALRPVQLGTFLVRRRLIDSVDLARALLRQRSTGRRLGETLVELGVLSKRDLLQALADHFGVPFVDLEAGDPDPVVAATVPESIARRYLALPVDEQHGHLLVAMANPNDVFALDDLHVVTGKQIVAALADDDQILRAFDRLFQRSTLEDAVDEAHDETATEVKLHETVADVDDAPVVRLVNTVLQQAVAHHASDVHVEPAADKVAIRLRVDGILHDLSEAPPSLLRPLVSRLKILGGLDIAQSRVPEDGRFSFRVDGRVVDIRIATLPTVAGEAVVLRLLDPERGVRDVRDLGLSETEERRFLPMFRASQGAIFITGPTGSGKTSTLYAALAQVNTREKNIVSVEDPVEYRVDGVKQIPINARAGMTFPSALRSILRADPDVVLIGEVRDKETARIAADAAISGHLVLSTLHARSAAAAPMRLIDMGVEPYLVASALTCVASQRLARRLCDRCAVEVHDADLEMLSSFAGGVVTVDAGATVRAPKGCPSCFGTGYQGRTALFEIMPVTEEISRLIVDRAPSSEIERVAVGQGMDTLRAAALRHVLRGELAIEEMLRVVS